MASISAATTTATTTSKSTNTMMISQEEETTTPYLRWWRRRQQQQQQQRILRVVVSPSKSRIQLLLLFLCVLNFNFNFVSAFTTTTTTATSISRSVGHKKSIGIGISESDNHMRRRLIILLSSSSSSSQDSSSQDSLSQQQTITTTAEKVNDDNTNEDEKEEVSNSNIEYRIRDCTYQELNQVAALMMTGFYNLTKMNIMSKKFTHIAELNRLQQSYPNDKLLHRMLIVEAIVTTTINKNKSKSDKSEIVGFCDVDCRPCNIQLKIKLPRPYISDLTINNHHRRQGLAKLLVTESEQFVMDRYNNNNKKKKNGVDVDDVDIDIDIWIRVEENNIAALKLYQTALGYKITNWSTSTGTSTYKEEEEDKDDNSVKSVSNTTEDATKIKIWTLRKILRK
jgi:ribosomal protein S18 acetylase RimI-like enzyme